MKNLYLKLIFTGALLITLISNSSASHLLGGEIKWECTGTGDYRFTLIIYGDCNGALGIFGNAKTINSNSPAGAFQVFKTQEIDVSPSCFDATQSITCQKAINAPAGTYIFGAVKEYTYTAVVTNLNGVPPVGGWEFSFTEGARPSGDQNHTSSNFYLRARMYPYSPTNGGPALNTSTCYDNSPSFGEVGSPVICTGYNFIYNHLALDKDLGDSLAFSFAQPYTSANTPILWKAGYSFNAPYPDAGEDPLNGPVTLDAVSGEMSMEVHGFGTSAGEGSFASCIKIEAWRNCQKIAEVFRDVSISLLTTGCTANNVPVAVIDTAQYKKIKQNGSIYRTQVYPTDKVEFELRAQDFDFTAGGSPQQITFTAGGLQVSTPLSSGVTCLGTGTCAKFTPIAPQTGFVQGLQNNIKFEWTPDCSHLATVGSCGGITSTYYFTLKMTDDACPAPAVSITTLIIDVLPGDPTAPPLASLFHQPNGDIDVFWNKAEQDSALDFNYYRLYGSNGINGPYSVVDSIANIDSLQTTVPAGSGYTCFYLIKSTGACDFLSEPSDSLCCVNLQMTVSPPAPNSEYASLEWTPLHNPLLSTSTGIYEVWTQTGVSPWIKVADVPQVIGAAANYKYIYEDTVSVCSDSATYQIRILDLVNNFYSGSNYQGAVFSDKTNGDIIEFDSVSVDLNGKSILSWTPSSSPDVIDYYLLFNDPVNGWGIVDTIDILNFPYVWDDSEADTRSEQFKIITSDTCKNFSNELFVVSHNTIYLENSLNKCDGISVLDWNEYDGFPGGAGGYNLMVKINDGTGFGPNTLLYAGSSTDFTYTHLNLQTDYEYCYTVQAYDTAKVKTSTSNPVCITADVPQSSRILYIAHVTNNFLRGSVDLKAFIDGDADVSGFDIERSTEIRGIYESIGNVAKPSSVPYVVNFSDYSANAETVYYYRLRSNNLCGGTDMVSESARNLVLEMTPNSNLTNTLTWNTYRNWGGGVGRYDIYRSINNNYSYTFIGSNAGSDSTFSDNVRGFGLESGEFCYYIQAVEDNNPLGFVDNNGQPFTSASNQVCDNQKAPIYVPTAFRPGSDVEVNRTFGPTIRFNDISDYDFYILNRWGSKVFQTNDPDELWDGKVNGEIAPMGVYVYYIKYSTLGDKDEETRGTFSLLN